jgi:hypothetical protein
VRWTRVVCTTVVLFVSGCGNPYQTVVKPTDITLGNALSQVVMGIAQVNELEKQSGPQLGTLIDQVDIDLQLAVTGTHQDQLSVAIAAPSGAPIGGSLGASDQDSRSASRGSTIHLTLKSVITAPLNYVGCFYFQKTEYSEAATKGCSAAKPADSATSKPQATAKKTSNIDVNAMTKQAVRQFGQDLVQHDTGFVITQVNR